RKGTGLVVAGPGMLPGAELPDVAGDDEHHSSTAGINSLMEIMTGTFAVVYCRRLDRAGIPCPSHQEVFGRSTDLMTSVQIVILEMHQVHLPDRHRVDLPPIQQFHPVGPGD